MRFIHKLEWKNSWQGCQGWKITDLHFLIHRRSGSLFIPWIIIVHPLRHLPHLVIFQAALPALVFNPLNIPPPSPAEASGEYPPGHAGLLWASLSTGTQGALFALTVDVSGIIFPRMCSGGSRHFSGGVKKVLGCAPSCTPNLASGQPFSWSRGPVPCITGCRGNSVMISVQMIYMPLEIRYLVSFAS